MTPDNPSTSNDSEPNEFDVPDASVELVSEACLVIVSGNSAGRTLALTARETIIGRGSGAQIRLNDRAVSTLHARVIQDGGRHVLVDLGSTNGTSLNGTRLEANRPTPLSPGDSIQIAETVLAYMPSQGRNPEEQTQYISRAIPQISSSNALVLGGGQPGDLQLLAQLLEATSGAPPAPPKPTLEEQLEKLRQALRMVRRNWIPLFVAGALGALAGDGSVFLNPPLSDASFMLRISPPPAKDNERFDPENQQFFTAAEQDWTNPSVVKPSLVCAGTQFPSPWLTTVTLASLKFQSTAYMTYTGSFKHKDPRYAVKFLQCHAESYVATQVNRSIHVVQAEVDFLGTRLKEREAELTKTEGELKEFKAKHLVGLPEFSSGHVTSRETLLQRRAEVSAMVSRSRLEFGEAQRQLKTEAPVLAKKVGSAAPFEQALADVERKLSEARSKGLGDLHPEVATLRQQRADLKQLAENARTSNATDLEQKANPALIDLNRRVGSADVAARGAAAELGAINAEISRLDEILKSSPDVEAKYAQLTRSYATNKEMYTQLFTQQREAQLKLDLERTSARARYEILAAPSSAGVALRKVLIQRTLIGVGLGLVVGALIAAVLELRRFLRRRRAPSVVAVSQSTALARRP